MNLIIKTKGNQPIAEKDKKWAEAKFLKLTKLCPSETVVEVTLEDLYGPKRGEKKNFMSWPKFPTPKSPSISRKSIRVFVRPSLEPATGLSVTSNASRRRKKSIAVAHHAKVSSVDCSAAFAVNPAPRKIFLLISHSRSDTIG